ncbi:MAG: DUF1592 domain-containing protein [Myxococcota bacterium]
MSIRRIIAWWLPFAACGSPTPQTVAPVPDPSARYAPLPPVQQLVRVSMALRGLRPSATEVAEVEADPRAIDAIVDRYLDSAEFAASIKDMHAELYLVRADTNDPFPSLGILEDYTTQQLFEATSEEPLELVKWVVTNDLPYTEIVTADYVVANDVLSLIYGLDHPPGDPTWSPTHYEDGRPHAGVLSTSEPYRRHVSNGSNFHRGRANFWATTLLCESFATRDVVVEGGVDLSDEAAVAEAVRTNPTCVGCHQALDPMADLFWGFRRQLTGRNVRIGEGGGCRADVDDAINEPEQDYSFATDICYPLNFYTPANEGLWDDVGLRPPSYYGTPVHDLADLGAQIAADPRFAQCSARQFYRWFAEIGLDEVGPAQSAALQQTFASVGYRVKPYLKSVVLSEPFLARERLDPAADPAIPLQVVRPEQYGRTIEQLTGFQWLAVADRATCGDECWGAIDLAQSDVFGYRAMSGGVDGLTVTHPTHTVTPVKLLVATRFATEAASYVVRTDFDAAPADRHLLGGVEADTTDEAAIRAVLAELSLKILTERVDPAGPEVDGWYDLFAGALADHGGDTRAAWTVTISAFLRDPTLLYY